MPTAQPYPVLALGPSLPLIAKLLLAILLAAMIGWERKAHGRPAGLRTHILVVIGVMLFCEASKAFSPDRSDRIAAQIVTGIGFLGAGTIMRMGAEIRGLTSAASVWATAAIGMAVSVGGSLTTLAVVATVLSLLTLEVLERIENRYNPGALPGRLDVVLSDRAELASLLMALNLAQIQVTSVDVLDDAAELHIVLQTAGFPAKALRIAESHACVRSARLVE